MYVKKTIKIMQLSFEFCGQVIHYVEERGVCFGSSKENAEGEGRTDCSVTNEKGAASSWPKRAGICMNSAPVQLLAGEILQTYVVPLVLTGQRCLLVVPPRTK